jgi:hypothetical protein
MSQFRVIQRVGDALREVLLREFREDPDEAAALLSGIDDGDDRKAITLAPPAPPDAPQRSLSLWLYLVNEREHSKNRPHIVTKNGEVFPPPLSLSLYYLVTPGAPEIEDPEQANDTVQEILGKVLQVFYAHPIIALVDRPARVAEELHVNLDRLSMHEMMQLWSGLRRPYRLSVGYRVNIARIDSLQLSQGALIMEREFESTELVRQGSTGLTG